MQQVTYCLDVEEQFASVYHPEVNPVIKKNWGLKSRLAILIGTQHKTWAEKLPKIRFAYFVKALDVQLRT